MTAKYQAGDLDVDGTIIIYHTLYYLYYYATFALSVESICFRNKKKSVWTKYKLRVLIYSYSSSLR
jgi:hypothetical protein